MNSTRWLTLTEFVKHLGRTGQCKVEETEKGWFITLIRVSAWLDGAVVLPCAVVVCYCQPCIRYIAVLFHHHVEIVDHLGTAAEEGLAQCVCRGERLASFCR